MTQCLFSGHKFLVFDKESAEKSCLLTEVVKRTHAQNTFQNNFRRMINGFYTSLELRNTYSK